jgi:hypothetical protein
LNELDVLTREVAEASISEYFDKRPSQGAWTYLEILVAHTFIQCRLLVTVLAIVITGPQELAQSAGTTPNEAEVNSSNLHPPSCADMSKRKKEKKKAIVITEKEE